MPRDCLRGAGAVGFKTLRYFANVNMDRDRGNRLIAEGLADLVAFGRPYIANPDLVQRIRENAPLANVDWETVYGPTSLKALEAYGNACTMTGRILTISAVTQN
jgi:2,4-dienoyl-CoA reductase-like NADH-dependent reductase (Old Yellow Enzyme family)